MDQHRLVLSVYGGEGDLKHAAKRLLDTDFSGDEISLLVKDRRITERLVRDLDIVPPATAAAALSNHGPVGPLAVLAGLGAVFSNIAAAATSSPIGAELKAGDPHNQFDLIVHALVTIGVADREAQNYAARIMHGDGMVAVICVTAAKYKKATTVLRESGAEMISSVDEAT